MEFEEQRDESADDFDDELAKHGFDDPDDEDFDAEVAEPDAEY